MFNSLIAFTNSLTFKGMVTGFLVLLMLIPAVMTQEMIEERKERQSEVIAEVSSKWADQQTLTGPYLHIPYSQTIEGTDGKITVMEKTMVLLPEILEADGKVDPHFKRRGIFEVALYRGSIRLKGHFSLKEVVAGPNEQIRWQDAVVCLGLSDTRGIETQPMARFGNASYPFAAGIPANHLSAHGASFAVNLADAQNDSAISFEIPLQLRGSQSLWITPIGKSTAVTLSSPWPSPSFNGKFLPDYTLTDSGFTAKWSVLHFNRDFPQVWRNQTYKAEEFSFGFSLLQPADHYAKTLRSVKYAILFIGLTFGFFFLLEALQGHRVHPVQYILTGIALVVFYSLLLSFGEIISFNAAYAIAALATTGLITLYGKHLFASWKNAIILGGFLGGLYGFIFVLIQLEDTSLLAGSIGLFILVAVAMHLSRKIKWYGSNGQ